MIRTRVGRPATRLTLEAENDVPELIAFLVSDQAIRDHRRPST